MRQERVVTILDEILEHKRVEVDAAKRRHPPDELARRAREMPEPVRGFRRALVAGARPAVIAEIKRRSPSRGEIRPDFDPVACAKAYADAGAAALSVLTDERFFGGCLRFLESVRAAVDLPILRKDFTVDAYQIDEARVHGADAVLLIAAALADDELVALRSRARGLGLDVLVEVHDEAELERACAIGADLVGVNNRDLRTFEVDLATTERLARRLASERDLASGGDVVLVSESGILHHADVRRLESVGARGFLVGESLMREPDLGQALRRLRRPA